MRQYKRDEAKLKLDILIDQEEDNIFRIASQKNDENYFKTNNICKYKRMFYHNPGDFIGEKEALSNETLDYLGVAHSDRVLVFTIPTHTFLSMFDLESSKTEFIVKCL